MTMDHYNWCACQPLHKVKVILVEPDFVVPFLFYCSGGLRLKRDITEYGDFVRSFNAPSIDEKFELLGM